MNNHSETIPLELDKKNRKRVKECPCGKSNKDGKFIPFIGYESKGYCHSCGETILPSIDNKERVYAPVKPLLTSFIDLNLLKNSLNKYENNNLIKYLYTRVPFDLLVPLIEKYLIGTSKHWNGSTVFWQVDKSGKVRTGKIMLYDPFTGKRSREEGQAGTWVHSVLNAPDFNLKQCFFGEHLLCSNSGPVAIVESEKTAIVASIYFPEFIWLACGGKNGLSYDKMKAVRGRKVVLFPDLSKPTETETAFALWTRKAVEFSDIAEISVDEFLERNATEEERRDGMDIADYLLRYTLEEFKTATTKITPVNPIVKNPDAWELIPIVPIKKTEQQAEPEPDELDSHTRLFVGYWNEKIAELKEYFLSVTLPETIALNGYSEIVSPSKFVQNHLSIIEKNNGCRTFLPYLERLQEVKNKLEQL